MIDYDVWITKEDEHIKIVDMSEKHLENTIKHLEKKLPFAHLLDFSPKEYIFRMKNELRVRGLRELIK